MGWLSYHRPKGETDRAHFERELLSSPEYEIVQCASKNRVFYAAIRTIATGEVWALVVLMRWARGRFNFAYKDMHESTGPYAADAPASVLDVLTPTDNADAIEWRERCRANLARRNTIRDKLRGVIADVVIRTAEPVRFENGLQASQFRCVHRTGRTIAWQAITDDGTRFLCNLGSQWEERHRWEISAPAAEAGSGPAPPSPSRAKPGSDDEEALLVSGQEAG
ncbi:DUF6927 domain-containing protein [Actinophytocola sp.]|uniref:DUF6927 domain-containing protein n=1 Tax=Actinophytocola sp. TaxID=1872138 RepID=UPI003D6B9B58